MIGTSWEIFANAAGEFSIRIEGGTVAFCESSSMPADDTTAMVFPECFTHLKTATRLWVRAVSGSPRVDISRMGITSFIPLNPGVMAVPQTGTATPPATSASPVTPITPKTPEYYFVIPVAGQSNMMAYGEGLPLPDTLDAPHPRIKQLARRATVTPGGAACQYNDVIPL
ncbi:sialate O-acetylesterase, partial [Salmonella enterica subsp. enterica serovar Chandans]|nr:sialate O-acetylesterase [Salmonella enterica subsp. enterica serovar Chandans]